MSPTFIRLLVEGDLDEAVGRRLAVHCGLDVVAVYGRQGAGYVREKVSGFNRSAAGMPVVAIADSMDMAEDCPPATIAALLPHPHPNMRFRLAVPEIESWLLADSANLSEFLGVPQARMPMSPDALQDPKAQLVSIARRSRRSSIVRLVVPLQGTGVSEGPGYTSEMQRFVDSLWDIPSSMAKSPSLSNCVHSLESLPRPR